MGFVIGALWPVVDSQLPWKSLRHEVDPVDDRSNLADLKVCENRRPGRCGNREVVVLATVCGSLAVELVAKGLQEQRVVDLVRSRAWRGPPATGYSQSMSMPSKPYCFMNATHD